MKMALDARDGIISNMLSNQTISDLMAPVQNDAVWSVLDAKGTQYMMRSVLSQAPAGGATMTSSRRRCRARATR